MFNLIIAIVSIALIVATVAATMYHGGDTLTTGRANADAAAVIAGAQQVSGAAVMFQSLESASPANLAELVTKKYLASEPNVEGIALDFAGKLVTATGLSKEACTAVNKNAGADTPEAVTVIGDLPYACVTSTGAFSFKF